ncbi:MAG: hypothetical protein U1E14_18995 [Geminicoccaceae bacterium]
MRARPADTTAAPHRLALGLAAAARAATLVAVAALLVAADQPDGASGDLVAVFAPGTSGERALQAVVAADGIVRRGTWLGTVWEVTGDRPGLAGRLRGAGALLVLPVQPFASLSLGGCSFLPIDRYPPRGLGKLRAGPL